MALKILQVFRTLYDVASCEMPDGSTKVYSMLGDDVVDPIEREAILNQLETAYKIKFERNAQPQTEAK